jgi:hypothetical protein
VGAADDLWKLGKPRGHGGPWAKTAAQADVPSDPYLMTGYDRKTLSLENHPTIPCASRSSSTRPATAASRRGARSACRRANGSTSGCPDGLNAYWVRAVSNKDAALTCQLTYE